MVRPSCEAGRQRMWFYGSRAARSQWVGIFRAPRFESLRSHIRSLVRYLLDQFLQDGCNKRTDEYGGSVEKRCRFVVESLKETIAALDGESGRVAIRLAPWGQQGGISDSNMEETFSTLIKMLAPLNLAYIHFVEPPNQRYKPLNFRTPRLDNLTTLYHKLGGIVLTCGGYLPESAATLLANTRGHVDLVGYARYVRILALFGFQKS